MLKKSINSALLSAVLLLLCLPLTAQNIGLSSFKKIPVLQLLKQIEKKYDVYFVYRSEDIDSVITEKKIFTKDSSIQQSLDRVLPPLGLRWSKLDDKNYAILKKSTTDNSVKKNDNFTEINKSPERNHLPGFISYQQPYFVAGIVKTDEGEPLPGATITVKGKLTATTANAKGYYKIEISSSNQILIFSSIGFLSKQINAGNEEVINVSLFKSIAALNQVVVIGYGTQKIKDVSSAVSKIGAAELNKMPVVSVAQMLQGRAAGVLVMVNDGNPGGGISVRIRGYTSASPVGDNSPLFVIDGVPTKQGINLVSPGDIETIDILKDAAAQAIYGLQAANGVVVITTKKGKAGEKARVTLNTYTGIATAQKIIAVTNPREHAVLNKEFADNANLDGGPFLLDSVAPYNFNDPASFPITGTNWQKEIFRKALVTDINLGFSGSAGKTVYAFGLGYHGQEGIIRKSYFNRYSFRASADQQVTSWLKAGTTLNYSYATSAGIYTNSENDGLLSSALRFPTNVPPRNSAGVASGQPTKNALSWGDDFNPLGIVDRTNEKNILTALYGNALGDVKITKGINFRSLIGFGRYTTNSRNFQPRLAEGIKTIFLNSLYQSEYLSNAYNWDNYFSFNKIIKGNSIAAIAGYSFQRQSNEGNNIFQTGFPDNQIPLPGLGSPGSLAVSTNTTEIAYQSYFTRLNYNYKEKYYVQAVIRKDASSRFRLRSNRWGTFPAISAAWRLSKEKFVEKSTWINELKLRASYGVTGNDGGTNPAVNYYPGYSILKTNQLYAFGNNQSTASGVSVSSYGNPAIAWEKNKQFDVGIDAALFNNQFSFTVDYYNRITKNMLFPLTLPGYFGTAFSPMANAGSLYNKGFEFLVNYAKNKGAVTYTISVNGAFNKNRVTNLNNIPFLEPEVAYSLKDMGQVARTVVGQSIGSYYGWQANGVYQNYEEIDAAPKRAEYRQPGDVSFADINKDGVVDVKDRGFIGSPIPKFTGGLNITAAYKNIDFNIFMNGNFGNKIYSFFYYYTTIYYGGGYNRAAATLNRWHGEGTSNVLPRLSYIDPAGNIRPSSLWIFDGSFVRLATVQAGYTFNTAKYKKLGIEKIRAYISAANLYTFSKYWGFDPEVAQNGNDFFGGVNRDLQLGVDRGAYPQPKTFLIGLNVIF